MLVDHGERAGSAQSRPPATRWRTAHISVDDIDLFEINDAFAVQVIASARELANKTAATTRLRSLHPAWAARCIPYQPAANEVPVTQRRTWSRGPGTAGRLDHGRATVGTSVRRAITLARTRAGVA
jgi:hypothetical protein